MLTGVSPSATLQAAAHVAWWPLMWICPLVVVLTISGCRDTIIVGPATTTPPVDTSAPPPVDAGPPLDTVRLSLPTTPQIASGGKQSCVLRVDGTVVCWGDWGGIGPTLPTRIPTTVDATGDTVAFALIGVGARLCALSVAGEAFCQTDKRLSSGVDSASTPRILVRVATRHRFRTMTSGYGTNCALTPAGQGFCWGDGAGGSLGDGKFGDGHLAPVPIAMATDLRFRSLAIGGGSLQCAVSTTGYAYCWGSIRSSFGDVPRLDGNCATVFWQYFAGTPCVVPTAVFGAPQLVMVSTGTEGSCGIVIDGRAVCWGVGSEGGLGNGSTAPAFSPVLVVGDRVFVSLTMGWWHVCALTAEHDAYCWGNNFRGYLGRGDRIHSTVPVAVAGRLPFASIAAGGAHVCAITTSGEVWCWGSSDYGQLGRDRSEGDAYVPIRVALQVQ